MSRKDIAKNYLKYLESGAVDKVVALFHENGTVESPVYGVKDAAAFYRELNNDTSNSELQLKGIFEEQDSNAIALYFGYKWTLKHGKIVEFDVVDIITFDTEDKITKLKIIYDTVVSRRLVEELKN
jgi:ketosteroid isomerase-like protein